MLASFTTTKPRPRADRTWERRWPSPSLTPAGLPFRSPLAPGAPKLRAFRKRRPRAGPAGRAEWTPRENGGRGTAPLLQRARKANHPALHLFVTPTPRPVGLLHRTGPVATGPPAEKATLGSRLGAGCLGQNTAKATVRLVSDTRSSWYQAALAHAGPSPPGERGSGDTGEVCGQGHRKAGKNETFLVWLLSSKLALFPPSAWAGCAVRAGVSQDTL